MARPDVEAVIGANDAAFIAAMNRVRAASKQAAGGLSSDFSAIGGGLTKLQGVLAGLGVGLSFEAIRQAIQSVGDIGDVADRVGVTTTALQEMRFAAEQNGAAVEDMDRGLQTFATNIAEAASGKVSSFSKILEANNISLRNANGEMKTTQELLMAYADLVANAATEQDRLMLTQEATGSATRELVGILSQGSEGFRENAEAAHALGIVLEDDVVRAGQKMGDEFDAIVNAMASKFKSLVVYIARASVGIANSLKATTSRSTDELRDMLKQKQDDLADGKLSGWWVRDAAEQKRSADRIKREILQRSIQDAQNDPSLTNQGGDSLRLDMAEKTVTAPTVIPDFSPEKTKSSGGGRAKAAREERDAVAELIARLEEEKSLVAASDVEKRIANETRRAGADATEQQKKKIADLITSIEAEEAAQKKVKDAIEDKKRAADQFASSSVDALFSVLDGSTKASDALKKLALDFARAAANAALLGQGPLASIFGTSSSGGLLGSLFRGIFGARAEGGPVTAGKIYQVGERGPELFRPHTSGTIIPAGEGGGGVGAVTVQQHFTISGAISDKTVIAMVQNAAQEGARMARQALQGDMQAMQTHGAVSA